MPPTNLASPALVVQRLIVASGLAVLPGIKQNQYTRVPQCFYGSANDDIDKMVLVEDCVGRLFGRGMGGEFDEHHGIKLTIRCAKDKREGYQFAKSVVRFLDSIKDRAICVDGVTYNVMDVYRSGNLLYLGEEDDKLRFLWGVYARVVFDSVESTTTEC